ncbi:hypothetical protein HPB49_002270 [Dermacentor silvarum]|uniref:Uncharacterized protein n=1 Tax=Dermacentor silvarum TaxID=543639 RepID=A0ACB8C0X3_DERSI|nr:hypothetical protein HPB49_002270 [Dermacentor silvarum]
MKCLRNGLFGSGYLLPDGPVTVRPVSSGIAKDGNNVALQALHGITSSHTNPNSFEVQRVSLAFQLFSDKVTQGLRLHRAAIEDTCGDVSATFHFFETIRDLIQVMTSRFAAEALRQRSISVDKLHSFLELLTSWELHTKGKQGFLSQSTATGLRVTLSSVLSLLDYLTQSVGFKYLITSPLSQHPVEPLFGMVRQSSGCNSHHTPQQFAVIVNCLSFSNLAHSVSKGNCEPSVLSALLDADASQQASPSGMQELINMFVDAGNIDAAEAAAPTSRQSRALRARSQAKRQRREANPKLQERKAKPTVSRWKPLTPRIERGKRKPSARGASKGVERVPPDLFRVEVCIVVSRNYTRAFNTTEELVRYLATMLNGRQRHNNKLRRRIAKLEREIEAHTSTLERQQWGQICKSLNGQLGCKKTWHLLRHLLDPSNTKSAARNQLTKIIHQYPGTDAELLADLASRWGAALLCACSGSPIPGKAKL